MKEVKFINEVRPNGCSKSVLIPSYIVKMLGIKDKDVVEITIKPPIYNAQTILHFYELLLDLPCQTH